LASSPVFRAYFLGYWNEIPEATSLYVTVEGRFFTTFFATGFSLTARIGVIGTGLTADELDWLELGVEARVPSFDLEQPTAAKLVIISKLAARAAFRLPLDAYPVSSAARVCLKSELNNLEFAMSFLLLLLTAVNREMARLEPTLNCCKDGA
jgi:hypothetical protein